MDFQRQGEALFQDEGVIVTILFWILFSLIFLISVTFIMGLYCISNQIDLIKERLSMYPIDISEENEYNEDIEETDK